VDIYQSYIQKLERILNLPETFYRQSLGVWIGLMPKTLVKTQKNYPNFQGSLLTDIRSSGRLKFLPIIFQIANSI